MNPFRRIRENTPSATNPKPQTTLLFLFAAFMFAQFVILRMGNRAGSGFLPELQQELVYFFLQIIVIGGFLAHALAYNFLQACRSYNILTGLSLLLLLPGVMTMLFMPPGSLSYLIVTGSSVLLLGFVGGAVYLRLSEPAAYEHAGACIGGGYAVAVALQYGLQLQWEIKPALAVLLVLSLAVMGFLLLNHHRAQTPLQQGTQTVSRSTLLYSVVITLALLLFSAYYNSYIHHLQIASGYTDYNVYSLPRLIMIPTVILFGWIADFKGGKLLPVCTLCVVSVALLNTALLAKETYLLNMCGGDRVLPSHVSAAGSLYQAPGALGMYGTRARQCGGDTLVWLSVFPIVADGCSGDGYRRTRRSHYSDGAQRRLQSGVPCAGAGKRDHPQNRSL